MKCWYKGGKDCNLQVAMDRDMEEKDGRVYHRKKKGATEGQREENAEHQRYVMLVVLLLCSVRVQNANHFTLALSAQMINLQYIHSQTDKSQKAFELSLVYCRS